MKSTLTTLALLSSSALTSTTAYVINRYSDQNCQNQIDQLNVYDSTCSTPSPGWSSFTVVAYGGVDQIATLYSPNSCAGEQVFGPVTADGSNEGFSIGPCYTTSDVANAAGSRA